MSNYSKPRSYINKIYLIFDLIYKFPTNLSLELWNLKPGLIVAELWLAVSLTCWGFCSMKQSVYFLLEQGVGHRFLLWRPNNMDCWDTEVTSVPKVGVQKSQIVGSQHWELKSDKGPRWVYMDIIPWHSA